jgi:drug/metabolite transporter (DMT)-like permease
MTIALCILIVAIMLGAAGQIALKAGINQLGHKPPVLTVLRSIFTPWVFLGFVCYGLSSLLYLVALSRLDLSYAYPLVSLSYVVVAFLSWRFLHETVPPLRIVGLAVVCIGVLLLAVSYRTPSLAAASPPPALHGSAETGGSQ